MLKEKNKPQTYQENEMFGSSMQEFAEFFIPKSSSIYNEIFDIEIENIRLVIEFKFYL